MQNIICFIPSITETLIDCGVNVVGRTRFCIHPKEMVESIKVVGGTKDVKWDKLAELEPDLVILDKEENTLEMAENCPYPYFALHITDIASISKEFSRLADTLDNPALLKLAERWQQVAEASNLDFPDLDNVPGAIRYLSHRDLPNSRAVVTQVDYLIWKDPWMAIGPGTFIWSVLCKLGFAPMLIEREQKYPNINDEKLPSEDCFYLLSSEPFPFEKHCQTLSQMGFQGAVIDGELYSWYGTRSLVFLESQLSLNSPSKHSY